MTKIMPQELDVWYLLPAIRRELAQVFIKDCKISQKEIAEILGLTESAISQYVQSKRANELKFSPTEKIIIKKTAEKILKDKKNVRSYIYHLSQILRKSKCLCKIHKKYEKNLSCDCNVCSC
ncbi:MAG: winged helix-turn-helix transcriptional regulator [Candidatus Pacearchaeota archaeon]|jgi:hypothetical protein